MTIRIGFIPSVIIGYLLGCFFTPYMFLNLQLTEWYNFFTYTWIFAWPFALLCHFVIWVFNSGFWIVLGLIVVIIISVAYANSYGHQRSARIYRQYQNRNNRRS